MSTVDRAGFALLCDIEQDLRQHVGDDPDRDWLVHWLDKIREYREAKYLELKRALAVTLCDKCCSDGSECKLVPGSYPACTPLPCPSEDGEDWTRYNLTKKGVDHE